MTTDHLAGPPPNDDVVFKLGLPIETKSHDRDSNRLRFARLGQRSVLVGAIGVLQQRPPARWRDNAHPAGRIVAVDIDGTPDRTAARLPDPPAQTVSSGATCPGTTETERAR